MNTRWILLGAVPLSLVAGAAVGEDCFRPQPDSHSYSASAPYAYSAPSAHYQPMTYSRAMTYSVPATYSHPLAYSVPVSYQPAYVQPLNLVAAQSSQPNCAEPASVSPQGVLTTLLPIVLPRLIDAILRRTTDPPVAGNLEARLASVEARLTLVEARLNVARGFEGLSTSGQNRRRDARRRGQAGNDDGNSDILRALDRLQGNLNTIGTQNKLMYDYLMKDEAFRKMVEGQ